MAIHIALIRAIGPVTHRVMRMASLRDACLLAGIAEARTVGNTGNIVCQSPLEPADVRERVQRAVAGFGLDNEVFIQTPAEMAEVVLANPFPEVARERPAELGVASFHRVPDWQPLLASHAGPEAVATIGAHLVVAYPAGLAGSKLRIEKRLGVTMTMRNWTVFARLSAMANAES